MLERIRYFLMALAEPPLHERHLVALRDVDALREDFDVGARVVCLGPASHHDRLGMMVNHARHEAHVGGGEGHSAAVGSRLFGRRHGVRG
jgi:hypothetical protein